MKSAAKRRRRLFIGAGLVVLYTLVGFLVLPPIVRAQLEKRLSAELGRRVTVEKVRLNPFTCAATFEGLAVREPDGTALFLGWRSLYVDLDVLGSIAGAWTVSEVRLDGFTAHVALQPDGSPNFADILAKFTARPAATPTSAAAPTPADSPGRPVRVGNLQVIGATVAFTDRTRSMPFATTLGPVTFSLQNFTTAPAPGAPYRFEAATEAGERFVWQGTLHPQPLQSAGEFRLENLQLPKYAPYYSDLLRADVTGGTLSLFGRYEANLSPAAGVLKLDDGAVQLRGLKLRERGATDPAVELAALDLKGLKADARARQAEIASIALTGGRIRARRDANGTVNLQAMLPPPAAAPASASVAPAVPAAAAEPKPGFKVGTLTLQDWHVAVTDLAAPRPVELALQNIDLSLRQLSSAAGAQMPLHLALGLGAKGKITIDGEVGLNPLTADLKTTLAAIEVLPFSPYLEQLLNARISQGEFGATLTSQVLLADGRQLAAAVAGDISARAFGLVDAAQNGELAGFQQLEVRGLRASTSAAQGLAIEEIAVAGPYARVVVNPDHTLNLAALVKAAPPAPAAPPTVPAGGSAAPAPKIAIGKVVVTDGDYRFTDRSIQPNVALALNRFAGTVTGLSSSNPAKAVVDLKGAVDGAGPVSITGKLDPLGPNKSVDLKVDFKNVDLLPLSPYSAKYAGYELARGKLLLDVKVLVDGKKIDTSNVITLSQFTFGRPVQSPDATKLPVRLGVALLKDLDGKIVIDVPVQGSTDDPDFRIGRVVLRVIVNLLTKAAVSPFSLLGAAFGGGGDELAYQEFAAGASALLPEGLKKLETMTKALQNRPALSVSLEGSFDPAADAFALKRLKLDEKVRRAGWETKRAENPNIPPPASIILTPAENVAALKRLFDAEFPPGTKFGAPVPPPPQPIAPPPAPAGFFRRLIGALTGATARAEKAAQAANARQLAEHAQAVAAAVAAGLPYEEMRQRLAETITVDDNDLRTLARARAHQVRDHLTEKGGIAPDRIFLAADSSEGAAPGKGPRVFLSLQ